MEQLTIHIVDTDNVADRALMAGMPHALLYFGDRKIPLDVIGRAEVFKLPVADLETPMPGKRQPMTEDDAKAVDELVGTYRDLGIYSFVFGCPSGRVAVSAAMAITDIYATERRRIKWPGHDVKGNPPNQWVYNSIIGMSM